MSEHGPRSTRGNLRFLAEAAHPGPWEEDDCNVVSRPIASIRTQAITRKLAGESVTVPDFGPEFVCTTQQVTEQSWATAVYIAAADPPTVLALLDDVARLTAALRQACDLADEYRGTIHVYHHACTNGVPLPQEVWELGTPRGNICEGTKIQRLRDIADRGQP